MKNLLIITSRDELLRMDISKIVYFEADGNYTTVMMSNKLKGTIGLNLSQTEALLAERLKEKAAIFARIGKHFIVNMSYVYEINALRQKIILSDFVNFAYQLTVSKEALKKFKDVMVTVKI